MSHWEKAMNLKSFETNPDINTFLTLFLTLFFLMRLPNLCEGNEISVRKWIWVKWLTGGTQNKNKIIFLIPLLHTYKGDYNTKFFKKEEILKETENT